MPVPVPARREDDFFLSAQPGFKRFLLVALAACSLGLGFRLYFAPDRIRGWIMAALENASASGPRLQFERAELVLRRGPWPAFAVRLSDASIVARPECGLDRDAARMSEIDVPLRVGALLFGGRIAAGSVDVADLEVDVDAWRPGCGEDAPGGAPSPRAAADKAVAGATPSGGASASAKAAWWKDEDLERVRAAIEGLRAERARVYFEKREKQISFERAEIRVLRGALDARFRARVPPELLYGEAPPPIDVEGHATADGAEATARAALGEGLLEVAAKLRPEADGGVGIDAQARATGIPASIVAPLARKAGALQGEFKPRFMWFDCRATIKGRVQGLFQTSPLDFENCAVDGDSGRVSVAAARRLPNGAFGPFKARVERADARAWLAAFGLEGPSGVFSDFGRVEGEFEHAGKGEWSAKARLEGARGIFIHRDARALQRFGAAASMESRSGRARGRLDRLTLDGGDFDGELTWDFDSSFASGQIELEARQVSLSPDVERVMLGGSLKKLGLAARVDLEGARFRRARLEAAIDGLESTYATVSAGTLKGELTDGILRVNARAGRAAIPAMGAVARALAPAFLGHRFAGAWIEAKDLSARLAFSDASVGWEAAQARLEGGRVLLSSAGNVDRARNLAGFVQMDFPKAKKARFALSGPLVTPTLEPISKTAQDAAAQPLSDVVLGL